MGTVGKGTIETDKIGAARAKMLEILNKFRTVQNNLDTTRKNLCEDWVGEGRNEFQTQYQLLISKVSDIGDSLDEMYQALVEAEAGYGDTDSQIRQEVVMSLQDAGITIDVPDPSR